MNNEKISDSLKRAEHEIDFEEWSVRPTIIFSGCICNDNLYMYIASRGPRRVVNYRIGKPHNSENRTMPCVGGCSLDGFSRRGGGTLPEKAFLGHYATIITLVSRNRETRKLLAY